MVQGQTFSFDVKRFLELLKALAQLVIEFLISSLMAKIVGAL